MCGKRSKQMQTTFLLQSDAGIRDAQESRGLGDVYMIQGDGGYGTHFKEIGNKLGPFDWAFVECGQYNELWHAIHLYPEESIQASIDMRAKISIPIHWGAFTLALHDWKDPVERFKVEAYARNQKIYMPEMGVPVALADEQGEEY